MFYCQKKKKRGVKTNLLYRNKCKTKANSTMVLLHRGKEKKKKQQAEAVAIMAPSLGNISTNDYFSGLCVQPQSLEFI